MNKDQIELAALNMSVRIKCATDNITPEEVWDEWYYVCFSQPDVESELATYASEYDLWHSNNVET